MELGVHATPHEGPERARVALVAGHLPLLAPGLAVGVEDASAEEVVHQAAWEEDERRWEVRRMSGPHRSDGLMVLARMDGNGIR